MNIFDTYGWDRGRAICYSGFRKGQSPGGIYPSYEQVCEDLAILDGQWRYLRLYDVDNHAQLVLRAIRDEGFTFKVMLGAYIEAEVNNFANPWGAGVYSPQQLQANAKSNLTKIHTLCSWANEYQDIVNIVSVGNEACVNWTDHYVLPQKVVDYASIVKSMVEVPVTFCENYVPWLHELRALGDMLDVISIHTYPIWEHKSIEEAIAYTINNYQAVRSAYPNKPVIITEAGWATKANGKGIMPWHANEANQTQYYHELMDWTEAEGILTYVFEAFDEPWKGSDDPLEPEKHWGLFDVNRNPKEVMKPILFHNQ